MHLGDDGGRAPRISWTLPRQMSCARQLTHFALTPGVGCDHFWPRWFGWLSDAAYTAAGALMSAIEFMGIWPATSIT